MATDSPLLGLGNPSQRTMSTYDRFEWIGRCLSPPLEQATHGDWGEDAEAGI